MTRSVNDPFKKASLTSKSNNIISELPLGHLVKTCLLSNRFICRPHYGKPGIVRERTWSGEQRNWRLKLDGWTAHDEVKMFYLGDERNSGVAPSLEIHILPPLFLLRRKACFKSWKCKRCANFVSWLGFPSICVNWLSKVQASDTAFSWAVECFSVNILSAIAASLQVEFSGGGIASENLIQFYI